MSQTTARPSALETLLGHFPSLAELFRPLFDDPRQAAGALDERPRFRLRTYFSLSAAIVLALITAGFVTGYYASQKATLLASAGRQNVAVAQSIANALLERLGATGREAGSAPIELARIDRARLAEEIRSTTKGLSILGLDVFDAVATPLFATDATRPVVPGLDAHGLLAVAQNAMTATTMSSRDIAAALEGPARNVTTVESVVPVLDRAGRVRAVFAISSDVTPHVATVRRETMVAALLILGASGLLFVVLFLIIGRADRIIAFQHESLGEALSAATKAEAEARAIARELEASNESITQLNVELAESMMRLREAQDEIIRKGKLAQLGQLTATVAHEIRNPLGAVRTAAFLVERKLEGKGLGVEKQFERITNGIKRCDLIISELLDFARSKAPTIKPLDFDRWLRGAVEEEQRSLPPLVAIELRLGLADGTVGFDPDRMRRVVINLLSNAAEAMVGKGKDAAPIVVEEPRIVVTTRRSGNRIELIVSDNGPGIDAETLQRIMEPLFTTKSFGVGLGLPAVEKILSQHGGGLEIASMPGFGATFTAWLPAAADTGPREQEAETQVETAAQVAA
jgi:signal transduction histidine kinase